MSVVYLEYIYLSLDLLIGCCVILVNTIPLTVLNGW